MGWIDPKIDWDIEYEPSPEDMNRMEGNTKAIKEENLQIDGNKTFSGDNIHSGTNAITYLTINSSFDCNDVDIENSGAILGRAATKRIEPAGTFAGGALTSYINEATIWTAWAALIPTNGQKAIINGGFKVVFTGVNGIIAYIERTSATRITIHYYTDQSTVYEYYWLDSTDTANWECALSW